MNLSDMRPESPSGDAPRVGRAAPEAEHCEWCGEPCAPNSHAYEICGFDICPQCLEDSL